MHQHKLSSTVDTRQVRATHTRQRRRAIQLHAAIEDDKAVQRFVQDIFQRTPFSFGHVHPPFLVWV